MKPRKPTPLSTDARPGRKDDPRTIAVREEIARQSEVQTSTGDGWDNPAIRAKRLAHGRTPAGAHAAAPAQPVAEPPRED